MSEQFPFGRPVRSCAVDVVKALAERFAPFAAAVGIAPPELAAHPNERAIVQGALADHRGRLESALTSARPEVVITLGNAALRVLRELVTAPAGAPRKLSADEATYGRPISIRIGDRPATWYPLAHPGSPKTYRHAQESWRPQ
jgi:hypothetical protein